MNEAQHGPLLVGQDNKSCIQIAENPGRHHGRTKHIEVRIRWIEREIEKGRLALGLRRSPRPGGHVPGNSALGVPRSEE